MGWTGFLIVEAIVTVIAAPAAGVLSACAPRRARLVILATVLLAIAASLAWRAAGPSPSVPLSTMVRGQLAWTVVFLAVLSSGALAATVLREPLDAVALVTTVWVTAAFGLLAAGPILVDLPTPLLDVAMFASPVIVVLSAGDVDLFRVPAVYQLSPIAHVRFDYPSWLAAALAYLVAAIFFAFVATRRTIRVRQLRSLEGIWT